jgi:antitoxin component of MazEF toxin-antitoxin module
MLKNLTKVGSSHALILSKEILALMGIEEGGQIEMQVLGDTVVLSPPRQTNAAEPTASNLEMALAYAKVKSRRDALFTRLAHQGEKP